MDKPRRERPEAEQNLGVFLNSSPAGSGSGFMVPMKPLNVGPGEPGPGDEWHLPIAEESEDEEGVDDETPRPGSRP